MAVFAEKIIGWLLVVLILGAALFVPIRLLIVAWLERRDSRGKNT